MKKKGLLKKGSSVALVATLIGSQLMTAVPFNVLAVETNSVQTQAVPYYSATVSTWMELKSALTNAIVTDIYLDADITVGEATTVTSTTKNIHGNDHTLNANLKHIRLTTANTVASMEDLKITNTDTSGLFWGDVENLKVTYKNIDHNGQQLMFLPKGELIIEGTVSSNSTAQEVFEGKQLTIKDNANVNFVSSATGRSVSPITFLVDNGGLYVGKKANLKVRSNAATIYGGTNSTIINYGNMDLKSEKFQAIHLASKSNMYFQEGSVLKAVAGDTVEESVQTNDGSIYVEKGATFEVEGNGTQGAVIMGGTFELAEGSNFSITNFNRNGSALGTYTTPANVIMKSDKGISTWDRGTVTNPMPTATYPGLLNAEFRLSGYLNSVKQTELKSNNTLFDNTYNTGKTGKIVGGSFASSSIIDQTTINKLDTDATLVTGTAEPKADVVIKVGSTILGQGKAGDDGKYNIAIQKQAVGTNVTATATWNAQTSSATTVVQKGTADQDAAKTAVDALFTDATKTGIKSTTDQAAIDAAQTLVNKVQDPTAKADLQKDLDKAQSLLNAKNEKAKQDAANTAVKELFTNNNPASNAIKETTNQKAIDDAQKTIDVLAPGSVKTALQADLDKAQSLLDARNQQAAEDQAQKAVANYAVNQLFVNNTPASDAIKASTDQDAIDTAQAEINKIKNPALKVDLQKDLDRAQELLDQRNAAADQVEKAKQDAARKAVNELFNNNAPTSNAIKPATNQATIDAAQKLIDAVTDPTIKAALQKDLDKAQGLLDARNAAAAAEKAKQDAAKKAVDELFNNNTPSSNAIKSTTTQATINAAQKLIDAVTDPTIKAGLQKDLDKAQSLLDAQDAAAAEKAKQDAAKKAVDELFVNNTPSSNVIKSTTDQAAVDAAQALVNKVTDPTKKAELQKDLDKAKAQLASKGTLKPDDFVLGTTSITGSYSGDVDRITLSKDGVESGNATKINGTFKFYVGPGITKNQSLYMVAYDKNGREIAREKVNFAVVTAGQITPKAMTIPGDSNISGTYTGDVSRIEVTITNEAGVSTVYKGGTVANGTFKFYSFDKTKSPKDKIVVRAYDSVGKLLDTKTVTITNNVVTTAGQVTPATMTIPGDSSLTGTVSGDVAAMKVTVNGTIYAGGSIASDGTFKFYTLDKIKKADDNVTIAVYDKLGKQLDSKKVTIQAPTK
ncbi:hypothetical protein HB852_09340 [Listeria grandensis]|uniref:toxin Cry1Ac domain D-VI-related protein n=1 Tax=Listeria grandensis TaxID=1494963 RepID=UPI00162924CC|nr:toxin Cry1Ac domain D-VI-related protein [Listeria grandensis]MBC1474818.1 hypothetical protein [Listeria grandensis]